MDHYSGEDGVTRFDDWLPSLERAASWNGWTAAIRGTPPRKGAA